MTSRKAIGSKVDLSTFKKWGKNGVIEYKTDLRRLKMALSGGDIVKDGVILLRWRYRVKNGRANGANSAKRQKLNEAGSDSFVATEEQTVSVTDFLRL